MAGRENSMAELVKKYFTLGCCGIDCGLCPRFYTKGESKCPGCFGNNFSEKHPACSVANCCVKNHGLEVCGQCAEFPCKKYGNKNIEKDSFVTHKKMMRNQAYIQINGIEKYIEEQNIRINILEKLLNDYNDGKSKSFFCIAAALLDINDLNEAIKKAENIPEIKNKANVLKSLLQQYAADKKIELKLDK